MSSISRRLFLGCVVSGLSLGSAWANEVRLLSAQEAHDKAQRGEVILIDVREPDEWAETGVAKGAKTIAMRDPALGAKLSAALQGNTSTPVALICRTGIRSQAVADAMAKYGFTNVYSVGDGMFGSSHGPGWVKSGLPVVKGTAQ